MPKGNAFPVRSSVPGLFTVEGVWTGGGAAADCAVTAGDWNRGIISFVYTATGKYTVTFRDFGQQIVSYSLSTTGATGVDPVVGQVVEGSYSATAGTVALEFGATLADLLTTNKVHLSFTFASNAP